MQAARVVAGDTDAMAIVRAGLEERAVARADLAVLAVHTVAADEPPVAAARQAVHRDEFVQWFYLYIAVDWVFEFAHNRVLLGLKQYHIYGFVPVLNRRIEELVTHFKTILSVLGEENTNKFHIFWSLFFIFIVRAASVVVVKHPAI